MAVIVDTYGREHIVPGPFHTVDMMKRANQSAGLHFFEPATMRFFRSRVAPGTIAGRIFITSEQFAPHDGPADARRYTVRILADDGTTADLSDFQEFATLAQARAFARRVVSAAL